MKTIFLTISALVLVSSAAFSQGQLDAYKISQTDLSGTARYLSMGGAFGALGGDISAMHTNPAGLAVYRSSEVVTTLSLNMASAKTNWYGNNLTENRTRFNFDNIAYVGYFPTANDAGIVGWNVGFSYNRMKNFHRNYSASHGYIDGDYSLSDYMAVRANGWYENELEGKREGYNPYTNPDVDDWLSIMAYNAFFIDPITEGSDQYVSNYGTSAIDDKTLVVNERGAIDQYNIAFGMNISDIVMLGANVAITDISYHYTSRYQENFENNGHLKLDNWLDTEGTGYSFNIGAIVQPIDYLRFGVSYTTPTWYKLTDYYDAEGKNDRHEMHSTPREAYTDYEYRAPDKWLFSAAAILGKTALISVDYELTNYKNMKMYNRDGIENYYTNSDIRRNFGMAGTLRVGAEVKVTPQFAVRAGAAWIGNPMKDRLQNVDEEVLTVGTIPHFTTEKSLTNYTLGVGYRFTPNFYMDLACVLKSQKENLYAFSKMYDQKGDVLVESQSASLKTNTTRVALTFGYKF